MSSEGAAAELSGEDLLLDAVFGDRSSRAAKKAWGRVLLPWTLAIVIHGALLLVAQKNEVSMEMWSAEMAARIHEDLRAEAAIAIEDAPPPPEAVRETRAPEEEAVEEEQEEEREVLEAPPPPSRPRRARLARKCVFQSAGAARN